MSTQSVNRQPAGTPSGGQFAAGSSGEAGVALAQPADDGLRDGTNPLAPSFEQTSDAFGAALADYNQVRDGSWDQRQEARDQLRSTAIQHAATEEGQDDVALRLQDDPEFGRDVLAWCDQGARRGAELERHAAAGIGEGAERIPVAEVRRRLPVGQHVEAIYPGASRPSETRVVSGQTTHEMKSRKADGTDVHNGWSHRQAWEDTHGNIIVGDHHGDPYVVYRLADSMPEPPKTEPLEDGSAKNAVRVNRLFPFSGSTPAIDLGRVTSGEHEYVTNRYMAIRNDQVKAPAGHGPAGAHHNYGTVKTFVKADHANTVPVGPDVRWSAMTIGPLTQAGYEVRANPDPQGRHEQAVHHIFADGEHVGWVMAHQRLSNGEYRGVRHADVPKLVQSVKPGAAYSTWEKAHESFETIESVR